MADSTYDVYAEITLRTKAAQQSADRLGSRMQSLGAKMRGTQMSASNLVGTLAAVGASYLGFRALTATIGGAARSMYAFETSAQQTKLGLATLLDALGGESNTFAQAKAQGMDVYNALQKEAAKTTATTQDLLEIFTGIVAPMSAAGIEMARIQQMAVGASRAGAALGVDQEQLTRDMRLLAEGRAGMDVTTFTRMQPFLKEQMKTTEAWNKATAPERIAELERVFKQMSAGAREFERSIGGRVSTFRDLFQQIRGAFGGPLLQVFADRLGVINGYLFQNLDAFKEMAGSWGERFAYRLDDVFQRAQDGIAMVANNWSTITSRVETLAARFKEMLPTLIKAAKTYAMMQVASPVAGVGIQGAGLVASGVSGLLGIGGAGAGAAGAAGAASAAGAAGTAAAGVGAAVALGAVAAALSVVAAATVGVIDQWDNLKYMFLGPDSTFGKLWTQLKRIGAAAGGTLYQTLRILGNLLVAVVGPALKIVVPLLRFAATGFAAIAEAVNSVVTSIADGVSWLTTEVLGFVDRMKTRFLTGFLGTYAEEGTKLSDSAFDPKSFARRTGFTIIPAAKESSATEGPKARQSVINDFRGSRIEIKQDFRDQDPDRVASVFMRDLSKLGERRLESGWAPPFAAG